MIVASWLHRAPQWRCTMHQVRPIRLKTRLFVMLVPPLVALAAAEGAAVAQRIGSLRRLTAARELVAFALRAGALIHEAQKERGLSSGFLGSGGKKFASELPVQRRATSREAEDLRAAAARVTLGDAGRAGLDKALGHLAELDRVRVQVDELRLTPKDSFGWYSNLIEGFLAVVEGVARDGADGPTVREATAWVAFLRAKEQSGRERATLNTVFAADKFDA